jgi:hypothetical protein
MFFGTLVNCFSARAGRDSREAGTEAVRELHQRPRSEDRGELPVSEPFCCDYLRGLERLLCSYASNFGSREDGARFSFWAVIVDCRRTEEGSAHLWP